MARMPSRSRKSFNATRLVAVKEAVASSPYAVLAVDPEGNVILANEKAATLFGYSSAELVRMGDEALIPARLRAKHKQHRADFLENPAGRNPCPIVPATLRDGTEIVVDCSMSTLETEQGVVVLTVLRERVDRERAEQALALAEQALPGRPRQGSDGAKRPALSGRELEVLRRAADGRTNKEIAAELGISGYTVQKHMSNILLKLAVASRSAACAHAIRERLIR